MTSTAAQAYYLPPAQSTRTVGGIGPHAPPPPALTGAPLAAAPYTSRYSYDPSLYTNTGSASTPSFAALGPVSGAGGGAGTTIGKIISLLHVLQSQVGGNPLVSGTIPLAFLETNHAESQSPLVTDSEVAPSSSFLEVSESSSESSIPVVVGTSSVTRIASLIPPPTAGPSCCCCSAATSCCGLRPAQNDISLFNPFPFDAPSPVQPQRSLFRGQPLAVQGVVHPLVPQSPTTFAQWRPISSNLAPVPVVAVPLPSQPHQFPWGSFPTLRSPNQAVVQNQGFRPAALSQVGSVSVFPDIRLSPAQQQVQSALRAMQQLQLQQTSLNSAEAAPRSVQFFVGEPSAVAAAVLRPTDAVEDTADTSSPTATSLRAKVQEAQARLSAALNSSQ